MADLSLSSLQLASPLRSFNPRRHPKTNLRPPLQSLPRPFIAATVTLDQILKENYPPHLIAHEEIRAKRSQDKMLDDKEMCITILPERGDGNLRISFERNLKKDQTKNVSRESSPELLACPVCFKPLIRKGPSGNTLTAISRSAFKCPNCTKAFSSRDVYLDLTIGAGVKEYEEIMPAGTELFRSPFVSFVYERGWRQNFARSGFPGADEEAKLAQGFLQPAMGGVLLDVSCGSGLFSRRFAKSNLFSTVVASDFSENMLRQCYQFIKQDKNLDNVNLTLIRADVERLPFATGSIDAVHAGAALHCWPSPLSGVAEVSRILRPGGVFVATTFLSPITDLQIDALKPFQQAFRRATSSSSLRYWLEPELEEICIACGLTNYKKIRRNSFIMLCASKPLN